MMELFELLDSVRDSEFERSLSQPSGGVEIYAEGEVGYDRDGVAVVVSVPDERGVLRDTYRPGYVAK